MAVSKKGRYEMEVRAPKGTMDILPPESGHWRQVQEKGTTLFHLYGYHEVILPLMEYTEVFIRSIGEGTDIVRKEMFTFEDKGGRSLTLRPEATAGVARAYVQHGLEAIGLPLKLYYQGSMFRHERPQAGRYRQFRQLGVELIGSPNASADAEVVMLCARFFELLDLQTDLVINSVGDEKCRPAYVEALTKYLEKHIGELCKDCRRRMVENPLRILDCKVKECAAVVKGSPEMADYLCAECREHFQQVEDLLRFAGIDYHRDARLVRGLDYYTRTVFEFQDPSLGAQNTLSAGGRYDRLIEEFGGKPTPAVGFSIGLERVMLAGPRLDDTDDRGVYILAIGNEARRKAFTIANRLRGEGLVADLDHLGRSPKAQMREADRQGFLICVIIGEEELGGGYLTMRDMRRGTQEKVLEEDLLASIKKLLADTAVESGS
jgi:histidyl-tRNA synthetase